eukprot:1151173-Rhodomonas_salina.1
MTSGERGRDFGGGRATLAPLSLPLRALLPPTTPAWYPHTCPQYRTPRSTCIGRYGAGLYRVAATRSLLGTGRAVQGVSRGMQTAGKSNARTRIPVSRLWVLVRGFVVCNPRQGIVFLAPNLLTKWFLVRILRSYLQTSSSQTHSTPQPPLAAPVPAKSGSTPRHGPAAEEDAEGRVNLITSHSALTAGRAQDAAAQGSRKDAVTCILLATCRTSELLSIPGHTCDLVRQYRTARSKRLPLPFAWYRHTLRQYRAWHSPRVGRGGQTLRQYGHSTRLGSYRYALCQSSASDSRREADSTLHVVSTGHRVARA